ncbi:MAG: uracil-DNA glycosylase [Hydrogenophaga sp.]
MPDVAQAGLFDAPSSAAAQLRSADPADWPAHAGWRPLLDHFWGDPAGQGLLALLHERLAAGAVVYPPHPLRALELVSPDEVRVVILGQDPYHGPGQAEGLAFSVATGVRLPPSLRNIFKELQRDLGLPMPADGSLVRWARQGVLLLNTCLTVEDGTPASHAGQGWEVLTDALIRDLVANGDPKAFLLWGAHAQKKRALIDGAGHAVFTANHPSPLSAMRPPEPFLGCGHFGAVNRWLQAQGREPVDW